MGTCNKTPKKTRKEKRVIRNIGVFALCLSLFAFAGAALCGCSADSSKPTEKEGYVIDCSNRQVKIPDEVNRIACLYAYSGHVCVLLDCQDQICAVVNGLKRDTLMKRKIADIDSLSAPYNNGAINIEELANASPDIIFLRSSNIESSGEKEKLNKLGVPYVAIDYVTMEDQIRSIEVMGEALKCTERAQAYTSYYQETIEMVESRLKDLPANKQVTVYHSVNEVVRTDVPGTLSYEVLACAGCKNVVGSSDELNLDGEKGMATVEQIYVWDPDVVLVTEPSAYQYFLTNDKFAGLRAVTEGKVYQLPVGISRWAHPGSVESPLATLYIAKLLYPSYFTDIDIEQETKDFYQEFFDIELSDEDVESIFSGSGMRTEKEQQNAV